jgi:hypothetical protein
MRLGWKTGFLATILLVLPATRATATYTPNPAARWQEGHFFVAGDFQYMDEKDLDPAGEIQDEYGLFVRPSFAFAPNATIYGRIGVQDADHVDAGFAIGGGLQAAWELPGAKDWAIGGSFDYLFWDLEGNSGVDVDYHELQLTPAVSYNIPQVRELTPYVGVPINWLEGDLEEDDTVGLLFGSNVDLDRWRLDLQFRVIHEEGLLLSAGYTF